MSASRFLLVWLLCSSTVTNAQYICLDKTLKSQHNSTPENGVYNYSVRWTNGTILKVQFLSGSAYVQEKVMYYAKMWESYANIKFDFSGVGTPDILVSFKVGTGSWSYIGADSKYYSSRNEPSMNFGWFTESTAEEEFKRTTLHEFGHALGLLHEHKTLMVRSGGISQ